MLEVVCLLCSKVEKKSEEVRVVDYDASLKE